MNEKKYFSKIGLNYLILILLTVIFQIIIVKSIAIFDIKILNNYTIQTIIGVICSYFLPLPIFIYLMNKLDSRTIPQQSINKITFIKYISITLVLMWIGNMIGLAITALISQLISSEIINPIKQIINHQSIYMNILIICIIAPVFEEIIFRKFLIDKTIKYGAKISILLSALIFALFHGNLNQFFYAFLMGGFFAYVYIKTGKIIYPIILHMIINFIGSIISTIFINSLNHLISSTGTPLDLFIVMLYAIIVLSAIIIGVYTILDKYGKIKFKKPEITLNNPIKTSLINVGIILFIIYTLLKIIKSIGLI